MIYLLIINNSKMLKFFKRSLFFGIIFSTCFIQFSLENYTDECINLTSKCVDSFISGILLGQLINIFVQLMISLVVVFIWDTIPYEFDYIKYLF